jgi:ketosteroid isomerase-like protein
MRNLIVTVSLLMLFVVPAVAAPADKEVLAAQDTWRQAVMKKDRALFDKVLHPELSYAHSSGAIETKAQAIDHVVKGHVDYVAVNFADTKVKVLGNTAFVTGKVDYHQKGKDKTTITKLFVLSVWVKGAQGWQMIARQATRPTPPEPVPTTASK